MKVCIEFNDDQTKILNKICIDGNLPKFLLNFMQKELFSSLSQSIIKNTPSHILYYEETSRLSKLVKLTQQEIAKELGFSQQAIAKAFKTQNERSVIYRAMTQHGSPDNFVFDVFKSILEKTGDSADGDESLFYAITHFNNLEKSKEKRLDLIELFILFRGFMKRTKGKQFDEKNFIDNFLNLDSLLINYKNTAISDRSAENLYKTLYEYYLSLGL